MLRVVLVHPVSVAATGDGAHPLWMRQIPFNGFKDATLKAFLWRPTQLPNDFLGINRIPAVVPRAVFDKGHLIRIGFARQRPQLVQGLANRFNNLEVGFFIAAPDVVSFAHLTFCEHRHDGQAMVLDI